MEEVLAQPEQLLETAQTGAPPTLGASLFYKAKRWCAALVVPHSQPQLSRFPKVPPPAFIPGSSPPTHTHTHTHPGYQPRLLLQQLAQSGGLLGKSVCVDAGQPLPEAQLLHLGIL